MNRVVNRCDRIGIKVGYLALSSLLACELAGRVRHVACNLNN